MKLKRLVINVVIFKSFTLGVSAGQIWFSDGGFANINGNQIWFSDGGFANISNGNGGLLGSILQFSRYSNEAEFRQKLSRINAENDKILRSNKKEDEARKQLIDYLCVLFADDALEKYIELKGIKKFDPEAINYRNTLGETIRQNPPVALATLRGIMDELDRELAKKKVAERANSISEANSMEEADGALGKIKNLISRSDKNETGLPEYVLKLQKQASQGDVLSQKMLAMLYENGNIIPKNAAKELYWLRKAVKSNDPYARYLMASNHNRYSEYADSFKIFSELYEEKPQFTPPEISERVTTSIEQSLGDAYFYGRGVTQNQAFGLWYYQKTASKGEFVYVKNLEMAKRLYSGQAQLPPEVKKTTGLFDDILREENQGSQKTRR